METFILKPHLSQHLPRRILVGDAVHHVGDGVGAQVEPVAFRQQKCEATEVKTHVCDCFFVFSEDSLLDEGVPVGTQEVPGHLVAVAVHADGDHHVGEVLSLHYVPFEALLHHPAR